MPETVGGGWITQYQFTRSFGVEPGSASGTMVLGDGEGDSGLSVGDYVVYTFGGILFYGVMSSVVLRQERQSGQVYEFQLVDNRVRLPWQVFFGSYNIAEPTDVVFERPLLRPPAGEFAAGGLSGDDGVDFGAGTGAMPGVSGGTVDEAIANRGRLFSHIVPSQWRSQARSYTNAPVSAAQILRSAFKGALGGFNFSLDLHPDQENAVYDIDANNGMTLAALVANLCQAQGLQVTLDGARTLRFERRGEGTLVIPGPPVHLQRDGLAMSADPTKVRVVGGRTLVQVNNIELEPDWKRGWERFISEPAWLAEVGAKLGIEPDSPGGRAEIAARAREITVREYIAAAGGDAESLADNGRWGKISRMNMPVWSYINSIVFRSYRIPRDRMLYGLPMCGMEIHETLLAGVQLDDPSGGNIHYRTSPVELYPQGGAFAIAKGQPLDLLAASERESVVRRTTDMREVWSEMSDFTLDAANASIRFASPVFLDGDPEEGKSILLYPNRGQGGFPAVSGLDADSDYYGVVVPNPGFEIAPAEVKISLVFRLGLFAKDYGTGARWSVHQAGNIAEHLLDTADSGTIDHDKIGSYDGELGVPSPPTGLKEILYEDGESALQKADVQAEAAIRKSGVERSGSYVRYGSAGTAVSGVIDRVSISVTREAGIVETVEFSKPRVSSAFVSSNEFAQRARSGELFEGQAELRREARQYRGLGRMERLGINDPMRSSSHVKLGDLLSRPIGSENASVAVYHDINEASPDGRGWRAGDIVWLDKQGVPSREGKTFGGVVVSAPGSGEDAPKVVTCAVRGVVPMAVKPDVQPGQGIAANPGDWKASGGNHALGTIAHSSAVPGTGDATLALVRLGADATYKGRYPVWLSIETQRLYVGPGAVGIGNEAQVDAVVRPFFPKLNGVSVVDSPYWSVTGKSTGQWYEVICVFDPRAQTGRMIFQKKGDDPEMSGCERAWQVAQFTFKSVGGKLAFDEFEQTWSSDIDRSIDEISCSAAGSSSESEGSDSDGGDSDSGSEPDSEPDSSDSESESEDDTEGSEGACCLRANLSAAAIYVGADAASDPSTWSNTALCYSNAGVAEMTAVSVQIDMEPPSPESYARTHCAGRLWLEVTCMGQKKTFYLGLSLSIHTSAIFVGPGIANQAIKIRSCVRAFGAGTPLTGVTPPENCCFNGEFGVLPDVCGE